MHRIGASLVRISAVCIGLAGPGTWQGPAAAVMAGTPAPDFEIVTLAGETFTKASLKGQPALLVFWAPWCRVCQQELPLLGQFYRHEKPQQLRVIAIGFADSRTNVEAFVSARSGAFLFPTAYDDDRWVAQAFKVTATPTYVLVDAQGQVVLVHRGGGLLQHGRFREQLSTVKE